MLSRRPRKFIRVLSDHYLSEWQLKAKNQWRLEIAEQLHLEIFRNWRCLEERGRFDNSAIREYEWVLRQDQVFRSFYRSIIRGYYASRGQLDATRPEAALEALRSIILDLRSRLDATNSAEAEAVS